MTDTSVQEVIEPLRRYALTEFRRLLESTLAGGEDVPDALLGVSARGRLAGAAESSLADAWAARFRSSATVLTRGRGALSLLSEEGHDQQVRVEQFVQITSRQCRTALQRLDARFKVLANEGAGVVRSNPISPGVLADAICHGLDELQLGPADALWVLDRCVSELGPRLGPYYAGINTRLADAGVLPDLEWQTLEATYRGGAGGSASGSAAASAAAPAGAAGGAGSAPAAEGEPDPQQAAEALLQQLLALLAAPSAASGGGEATDAAAGSPPAGEAPRAGGQHWSQPQFLDLASQLQRAGAAPDPLQPLGQILQASMRQAAQDVGIPPERSLPAQAEQVLDLVGAIFDCLLESPRLDHEAQAQLRRLAIPFVKIAILDRRVFLQHDHPARALLNQMVDACEDTEHDNPQDSGLRQLIFEAIDRIGAEFHADMGLFQELAQRLSGPIEARKHRVERLVKRAADTQLGQERREQALRLASSTLSKLVHGLDLQRAFAEFLCDPWRHHHFILFLREGDNADALAASEALARALVECAQGRDAARLATLRPQLDAVLASSGVHDSETGAFYDMLVQALSDTEMVPVCDGRESEAAEPQPEDEEGLDPARVEHYRHPEVGMPLDWMDEDRTIALRVGWTSPLTGRHLLCNRRGQRVMLASPQELARWESVGRLQPGRTQPAFDEAMLTAVLKLKLARDQAATQTPSPRSERRPVVASGGFRREDSR